MKKQAIKKKVMGSNKLTSSYTLWACDPRELGHCPKPIIKSKIPMSNMVIGVDNGLYVYLFRHGSISWNRIGSASKNT